MILPMIDDTSYPVICEKEIYSFFQATALACNT